MREVERYIAGRLEPAELCHGGPASDMTRKVAVVLASDYSALDAECSRLAEELDRKSVITGDYIARCQRLEGELAITRRVIDRIGQLCTAPHESKERFIRRVQSVIEWERAAQQEQPQ